MSSSKLNKDKDINMFLDDIVSPLTIEEAKNQRMSAQMKLSRAWDREQQKSEASRRRGEEVMAQAKKDAEKKKEQGVAEVYTPSPAKPFRNPPGFNKQGTGVGNKLAQQTRAELAKKKEVKEFAPGAGRDDDFDPETANMAHQEGVVKGFSLVDHATLEQALQIPSSQWGKLYNGQYKQYFVKGFMNGRKAKLEQARKDGVELSLQKDGSLSRVQQGVAEGADQVKKVFKDKFGKPVGEIGIDPESSPGNGEWYVHHYATGYSVVGFDSAAEAKRELMYVHKHPDAVEGHPSTKEQGVAEAVPAQASGVDPKIQFLQPTIQFAEKMGYRVTLNPQGRVVAKLVNKQLGHIVHIGKFQPSGKGFEVSMADNLDWQTNAWSAKELAQDFKEWHVRAVKDQDFNNGYNEKPQLEQQGVAEASAASIRGAIAISKKESGKYTKDGKRKKK